MGASSNAKLRKVCYMENKICNYIVIFKPLEEGGYDIIVSAIPEICTFGDTIEEAQRDGD